MEVDELAGTKDGISERFAPDKDSGRLIEAEHVTRYRWAAQAIAGRRVLDAGCGTAYGTKLLADGGAREVIGVDIAKGVLEAVGPLMPENARLEPADLTQLPYGDGEFETVVCFEVIEHFEDPFRVLDELRRVLAPDGHLLVSSPNRGVFPAGNPHHHHEFEPEELRSALHDRFDNVMLVRQQDYIMSAALSDEGFLSSGTELAPLRVDKLATDEPERELYTLAVAGNGELPRVGQLAVLTGTLEFREWLAVFDQQTDAIHLKDDEIVEMRAKLAERDELAARLVAAEQRLAEIPALQLRIEDLDLELKGARAAEAAAQERIRELEDQLMRSSRTLVEVFSSPSWRVTKPLRGAKRLLRR